MERKQALTFALGDYLFLEAHNCPRASLSETVRFEEQILPAGKYLNLISR